MTLAIMIIMVTLPSFECDHTAFATASAITTSLPPPPLPTPPSLSPPPPSPSPLPFTEGRRRKEDGGRKMKEGTFIPILAVPARIGVISEGHFIRHRVAVFGLLA
jgi:hypothetical protein